MSYLIPLKKTSLKNRDLVGGKNASTGEMLQHLSKLKIRVPDGFAITTKAFKEYMRENGVAELIRQYANDLRKKRAGSLKAFSHKIQKTILKGSFQQHFIDELQKAYHRMGECAIAVRSSAVDEDSEGVSAAGMQETYLNIKGLPAILKACKLVYASLFAERALNYRLYHKESLEKAAISIGLQPMIRSDLAVSGVIFTLDTESGFDQVIMISASYGLGEGIVKGQVNPDEFIVYKPNISNNKASILQKRLGAKRFKMIYASSKHPTNTTRIIEVPKKDQTRFCLTDKEVSELSRMSLAIEKHYGCPMDIEWAKDGVSKKLVILQARPETAHRQSNHAIIKKYMLQKRGPIVVQGQSIGERIGSGKARILLSPKQIHLLKESEVLVTDMTDPDWEPAMKKASAIVTNRGGRTCHAAIIARELGIPAVVGCIHATTLIKPQTPVTVNCAEGQVGYVMSGILPFIIKNIVPEKLPKLKVKLSLNLGNPEKAFQTRQLPNEGVGLARLEFVISDMIGIHPNIALQYPKVPKALLKPLQEKISGYQNAREYYIDRLRQGISMLAAAFFPKPVIFRFSDFKSNEYANLIGGSLYEPHEENPMIGFRGASRYYHDTFIKSFELECAAFKAVRDAMGLINAHIMIPFVRTVQELKEVIRIIEKNGLKRGRHGLKIIMMCEIPSNVILAKEFLKHVDGFSIGSNDLTQLTLGLDRDSNLIAHIFDERNAAVKALMATAIAACRKAHKYIGICGQAPSDYPELAHWLMQEGVGAISLNPDTIVETWQRLSRGRRKSR